MKTDIRPSDLIAATAIAFMRDEWRGTTEEFYEALTKFKNDDEKTPLIIRAMLDLPHISKRLDLDNP